MKFKHLLLLSALTATPVFSAPAPISTLPAATTPLGGTEVVPIVQAGVTKKVTIGNVRASGVLNVRTIYGGVPDGSTSNTTAITNAFAAANAWNTNSAPTVYFDCDSGATVCVYNYGGAGVSPINPTIPMNIECAQGVTLNYTGTAHAADIGAVGMTIGTQMSKRTSIKGCRWTGGATSTAGLYFNDKVTTFQIQNNEFISFGQANTYSVVLSGDNWDSDISSNVWHEQDGIVRGVLDAHLAINANIHFVNNKIDCLTAAGLGCPIPASGNGVGLWIATGYVAFNQILAHYPAIRLSQGGGGGGTGNFIAFNTIEGNTGGTSPAISYGDPGGAPANVRFWHINFNTWYWPTTGNINYIGPETPSSGAYTMAESEFIGNVFQGVPNGTTPYFKLGNVQNFVMHNVNNSGYVTQSTATPLMDTGFAANNAYVAVDSLKGNGTNLSGMIPVGDSTGVHLSAATYHNLSAPNLCINVVASGTAQICNTAVRFDPSGTSVDPVAGDMIMFKTNTTNTGALTIAVNALAAKNVVKPLTGLSLSAEDIAAGFYYPLVYDGTSWDLVGR